MGYSEVNNHLDDGGERVAIWLIRAFIVVIRDTWWSAGKSIVLVRSAVIYQSIDCRGLARSYEAVLCTSSQPSVDFTGSAVARSESRSASFAFDLNEIWHAQWGNDSSRAMTPGFVCVESTLIFDFFDVRASLSTCVCVGCARAVLSIVLYKLTLDIMCRCKERDESRISSINGMKPEKERAQHNDLPFGLPVSNPIWLIHGAIEQE